MSFSFQKPDGNTFNILATIPIFQFLSKDINEDQSNGNVNANGDYSDGGDGVTDFRITSTPGYWFALYRMIVTIRDVGTFDSGFYGNNIVLTNGIHFVNGANDGRPEFSITQAVPIKTNPDWGVYCFDTKVSEQGQGTEQGKARWSFVKMGRPVILDGDVREYAAIRAHDNLSGLTGHYFNIQGLMHKK